MTVTRRGLFKMLGGVAAVLGLGKIVAGEKVPFFGLDRTWPTRLRVDVPQEGDAHVFAEGGWKYTTEVEREIRLAMQDQMIYGSSFIQTGPGGIRRIDPMDIIIRSKT